MRGGIWWVVSQLVEQLVSLALQMHIWLTDEDSPGTSKAVSVLALHKIILTKSRPTVNIEDSCGRSDVTILRIFKYIWC